MMKRLWFLISGYDDAPGLEEACESIRALWPDADRYPIVYSDGAYEGFPHDKPYSNGEVQKVADKFASFTVTWPIATPTEYLKRTSYWVGTPGDYGMILDTDESLYCDEPDKLLESCVEDAYLVRLVASKNLNAAVGHISRLFKIQQGLHHWGSHEVVFRGQHQLRRATHKKYAPCILRIFHRARTHWKKERLARKKVYYGQPIRQVEAPFRKVVGV